MTLPASGPLSLSAVNTELQLSSTATISLNDTLVRTLFGASSGAISMSSGYSKEYMKSIAISANQTNLDLRTYALANGWSTSQLLQVTVNGGIYLLASSTSASALTVSGSFPSGVRLINNGVIVGYGGAGGSGSPNSAGAAGAAGGTGMSISSAISITNNSTIAGGGGGGGGGAGNTFGDNYGGGGGGGGATLGGGGGGGGGSGPGTGTGTGGGAGTLTAGGGAGGSRYAPGGVGGGYGAAGANGASGNRGGGGAGGAAGNYVNGNGFVTWVATGTRLGGAA